MVGRPRKYQNLSRTYGFRLGDRTLIDKLDAFMIENPGKLSELMRDALTAYFKLPYEDSMESQLIAAEDEKKAHAARIEALDAEMAELKAKIVKQLEGSS